MAPGSDLDRGSASKGALLLLVGFAGLAGAAGVALAAVAAHRLESPALATAAMMLMVHAVATLAIAAIGLNSGAPLRWVAAGAVMIAAASLFSGDVALHAMAGKHVFPYAAPIGGSLLIASWLAVALAAAFDWRKR